MSHAALMDATYRRQRLVYDATRKYYLLGRDHLIERLDPPEGGAVLEIACGTGRTLDRIDRLYPGRRLAGLDISAEMLRSARAKLPGRIALAQGDACDFDAGALVGIARFDRILLSYSLSMIPDWKAALRCAARHLADGGELHMVDFGAQTELPGWFHAGLTAWLARFHVTPRADLAEELDAVAGEVGGRSTSRSLYRGYARYGVVARPGSTDQTVRDATHRP